MRGRILILLALLVARAPAQVTSSVSIDIGGPDTNRPLMRSLFGVIAGPDPSQGSTAPNLTPQLRDIGVTTIRNNDYYDDRLDMEQMFFCGGTNYPSWNGDPDQPTNYQWAASDAQFGSWVTNGFEPFFRLGGSWQNATRKHDFKGPQNGLQETNWARAAVHVAERYNNFAGGSNRLLYLDLWTEFPGSNFWSRSNAQFLNFWVATFARLRTNFPAMKIGGPGFAPSVSTSVMDRQTNTLADALLRSMYNKGLRPDWLGYHLFSNEPETYLETPRAFRELLDGTGVYTGMPWAGSGWFTNVELICDAWGLADMMLVGTNPVTMSRVEMDTLFNHQLGAAVLVNVMAAQQRTEIGRAYWYRCGEGKSDPAANPLDPGSELGKNGLFHGDTNATYKPTAHAMRFCSVLASRFGRIAQTPVTTNSSSGMPVWPLAGRSADGQIALLLGNTDQTNALAVTITISNLPPGVAGISNAILYRVSNSDSGRVSTVQDPAAPIVLPPATAGLLVLTPGHVIATRAPEITALLYGPTSNTVTVAIAPGQRIVVDSAPDLATWSAAGTNSAVAETLAVDVPAGGPIQFHRARRIP